MILGFNHAENTLMHQICATCNGDFTCQAGLNIACWCMEYPPLLSPNAAGGCLCPACLTAAVYQKILQQIDTQTVHMFAPAQAIACQKLPLIEGLDYQIDAAGRWMLSRWYLLKRGECCGNACRNCPYGHAAVT